MLGTAAAAEEDVIGAKKGVRIKSLGFRGSGFSLDSCWPRV